LSPRRWPLRIWDISESINNIQLLVKGMEFEAFNQDMRTRFAVLHQLIVIGEAATHVPREIREEYPDIPWQLMADMRNYLAHEYWGVISETVWNTVTRQLPPLIPDLKIVLDKIGAAQT
jgi:uncharacterized protein with HEPN domain